jgi:hypothetical protein
MIVRRDSVSPTVATASGPRRDEENVDDGEHRLERLEDHRHGEQKNRAIDGPVGIFGVRAAHRFANRRPHARLG